jgi:hypothetical protein
MTRRAWDKTKSLVSDISVISVRSVELRNFRNRISTEGTERTEYINEGTRPDCGVHGTRKARGKTKSLVSYTSVISVSSVELRKLPEPDRQGPGISKTSMISTASPGKIVKCGCFSNSFATAS